MKRTISTDLLLAAAIMVLTACEDGIFGQKEQSHCTVQASAVQECIITRVGYDPENGKFAWKPGDTIAVNPTAAGKFKSFTLSAGAGSSFAEFSGPLSPSAVRGCAVYPWSCRPRFDDGYLKVSLPESVTFAGDTLSLPMYASAEDYAQWDIFYFKPLCGILRIAVPAVDQNAVKVVLSAGGNALSGEFDVVMGKDSLPCIKTREAAEAEGSIVMNLKGSRPEALSFAVPVGKYPELVLTVLDAEGQAVQILKVTSGAEVARGAVVHKTAVASVITDRYYTRVDAARDSWVGEYLLVAELDGAAFIMYTDSHFADLNAASFTSVIEKGGIPYTADLAAGGLLSVRAHKADASGTGPDTDQAGKYTMFLQDGRGIGRFARTEFGFNNNKDYGRFVCSFAYDADAGCMRISCTTKNSGEAYLRFDSSNHIFGMGLESQIKDVKYLNVQLYELK